MSISRLFTSTICIYILSIFSCFTGYAQHYDEYFEPKPSSSSQLLSQLNKLKQVGCVMYLAAHPDDENQRIISYFNFQRHLDVTYLSLTRGSGGQNLLGAEIKEELGLIRSLELLKARYLDGGQQMFSRAIDFGYSKTADETLSFWNKKDILGDIVRCIRIAQPDIIILRFPPDARAGHGHHTSSAQLALLAFDLAGDKKSYPEQLKKLSPWSPRRLFVNTGRWWNKNMSDDDPDIIKVDIGKYDPVLGQSYHEIASRSRSSHKTQGFGSFIFPQENFEYLALKKGDKVKNDPLEDIDTSWNRFKGGSIIQKEVDKIIENFDFNHPSKSVLPLLSLKKNIQKIDQQSSAIIKKLALIDKLLVDLSGIYCDAYTKQQLYTQNDNMEVNLFINNRSNLSVALEKITLPNQNVLSKNAVPLEENKAFENAFVVKISDFKKKNINPTTQPFWLGQQLNPYTYQIDSDKIGSPLKKSPFSLDVELKIEGTTITIPLFIKSHRVDPIKGRVSHPLALIPKISVTVEQSLVIFSNNQSQIIPITLESYKDVKDAQLKLITNEKGWKWSIANQENFFQFKGKEKIRIHVKITPPSHSSITIFDVVLENKEEKYNKTVKRLEYDHVPKIVYTIPAEFKAVKFNLKKTNKKIAYIVGSGDLIPKSLINLGFQVEIVPANVSRETLAQYDVLMLGIRAYNIIKDIDLYMNNYFDFVNDGGNMIVQYNTSHRLKTKKLAPYKLNLSRKRVTNEYSKVKLLDASHPIFTTPNKIELSDFENWVQERGLYFPDQWAKEFVPLIGWHDKGEEELKGALLTSKYGKGTFTYTGISFFREIPAGVPGAIKLLTNIIEQ